MGIQILIRTWKTAVSKSFNGVLWAVNYFPNKNVSLKLSIPSFSRNKPAGLLVQRKCHRKTVVLEKLPDSSGRSERSKRSERRSERSGLMQTCCLCTESWTVRRLCGTPVTQRGLSSLPVSQPVRDGEPRVSLQLRQNHEHLPERRNTHVTIPLSIQNFPPIRDHL